MSRNTLLLLMVMTSAPGCRPIADSEPPRAEPAQAVSTQGESSLERLKAIAERRFAHIQSSTLRLSDGRSVTTKDPAVLERLRLRLLRRSILRQVRALDPGLDERAVAATKADQPMRVELTWPGPSGEERVESTLPKSSDCGLPSAPQQPLVGLSEKLATRYLCLSSVLEDSWGREGATELTVQLQPIAESSQTWQRLVSKKSEDLAVEAFFRSEGQE